jgi:PAS domain S-box-containing protein
MVVSDMDLVFIEGDGGDFLGQITGYDLGRAAAAGYQFGDAPASQAMAPFEHVASVAPDMDIADVERKLTATKFTRIPVVDVDRALGLVTHQRVLEALAQREAADRTKDNWEQKSAAIINALSEGLLVMDRDHVVREFNPAAERLTGRGRAERLGRRVEVISIEDSPVFRVLKTGEALYDVEQHLKDGRIWKVNFVPLIEHSEVVGVVQTFRDITRDKVIEDQLSRTRDELDEAFALTLPNSRVERKLKSTPEYRDNYDPVTGTITVTEVISDGSYRHVVNALKVLADLNRKGVMHLLGMEKDILVDSVIFHDLGKAQPELEVSECVDPREAFESGMLHAERSADLAANYYGKNPNVVTLIRHHHHPEEMLKDFPRHLLPMFRLLKLADGLSASLTRRGGKIALEVRDHSVFIQEQNNHPEHCHVYSVNLLTGQQSIVKHLPLLTTGTVGRESGTIHSQPIAADQAVT